MENIIINDRAQAPSEENQISAAFSIKQPTRKKDKKLLICLASGIIFLVGGLSCLIASFVIPKKEKASAIFPAIPSKTTTSATYSDLTGETLSDASLKTSPAFCIQTPNGTDGARPQAGLNEAGVIFEAIAESGITRFAAIYQNPSSAVIGPIRSLRIYYLEWDTPFNCTIVHAGGASDALEAVKSGNYRDLSENYSYMYRGSYSSRLWNNLFTTSSYLAKFSSDQGYNASEIKGFARMTPEESSHSRIDSLAVQKLNITTPTDKNTSELKEASAKNIAINFGGWASFNVRYTYDADSNTYLRNYESGAAHEVYSCPASDLGEVNPEDSCELKQIAPSVVIAIKVEEKLASDNYHEDINTFGSGDAYIFQNGTAIEGTWTKSSAADQIKFTDKNGNEIKLAPGKTIISAIPKEQSVDF